VISPSQRPLPDNTQHSQETSMPGGIRTRNPNKQAASDPRLRPRGHRERQLVHFVYLKYEAPQYIVCGG